MITEDIQVIHEFTDKERADFSLEQANLLDERENIDAHLTQAKKLYAAQLAEADAKIKVLSLRIRTGTEPRMVRCVFIDHRPDEGYRLVVRTDNGHVFKRRKLEPHERQMKLIAGTQVPFVAIALLQVEDKNYDQSIVAVQLWQEEVDELKLVEPPLQMRSAALGIEAPKPEIQEPSTKGEKIVHDAEIVEENSCEYCRAGYPMDETHPYCHNVPNGKGGIKRRTCANKEARAK